MNCKPGDLAILVKSTYGNEGKIVTCIKHYITELGNDAWVVEPPLKDLDGVCDFCLRPIRPDETHEESTEAMRLLTQLPQKEKA